MVKREFSRFTLETLTSFRWATTRNDALRALQHFIDHSLPHFGDYQDAMVQGADMLFHSLLSPYLNCGLLLPREVCDAAEAAYHAGHAPLNAVEGFIRQILGWREYVRGIYWLNMPEYASRNVLQHCSTAAGILLDRPYTDELYDAVFPQYLSACLCTSYPASDGDWQFRLIERC